MRTAILVSFGLFGIAKGIALVVAPEPMVLATFTEPAARLVLCLMAAVLGALLLRVFRTCTPRLVGGLGVYGMLYGLVSMLVPAQAWAAYVEAVWPMLHHSVVGGAISNVWPWRSGRSERAGRVGGTRFGGVGAGRARGRWMVWHCGLL